MLTKTLKVLTALLTAALATMALAAPAGANYTRGVDIDLRVVNNSPTGVNAAYCPNGHVSIHYQWGTTHDPCNVTPFRTDLHAHGGVLQSYKANPVGVVVRAPHHHTLYFYARNPSIGKPVFEVNGHRRTMVEGELQTLHIGGAIVRLHREGDRNKHKIMTIELIKIGKS